MTDPIATRQGLHANAVVYGEIGVLIRGPSGSGKSALALALIARARSIGCYAALIGDDRVYVALAGGRLVARGAANMAGLIERHAAGILAARHEPAAVLRLAVEFSGREKSWPRMPDEAESLMLEGVTLPRLALNSSASAADHAVAVEERLAALMADDKKEIAISLEHSAAVHKNEGPPA